MSLEEHQQTDPEEQGLEAAGAPDTGNDLPTNDTPEDREDFPDEHAPEDGETPVDENDSTPEDTQDSSESGEVQETEETGETEKSGETGEKETGEKETGEKETGESNDGESDTVDIGELKIVLHLQDGRTSAGVWQPGADVHLETFMETDMSILVAELPGLLERAQARWNENPLRPKYEPPKKTPTKKASTKKTPTKKTPTKNQQGNQNETTPATETQQELELEPQQPGMARLF